MDLRHGCFLVKMYVKTKELGPIREGVRLARPSLDPPMLYILKASVVKCCKELYCNI